MFKKIKDFVTTISELILGTTIGILFFLLAPLIGFIVLFIVVGEVAHNICKWTIRHASVPA